jgi:hypothetical protein
MHVGKLERLVSVGNIPDIDCALAAAAHNLMEVVIEKGRHDRPVVTVERVDALSLKLIRRRQKVQDVR